ncbi:MAG: alpha/beta fold hydrolase [Coriobacteriia bacterium]
MTPVADSTPAAIPSLSTTRIALESTTLRVGISGDGPPVIMVPATISLIEDWASMIQFVGQRNTVHFFELPGHGGSDAFADPFSSERVAHAVGELADAIGADRFTLIGFSFGGLLTLKTLKLLEDRIDRVALLSPFVSHRALRHSPTKLAILRSTLVALRPEFARRGMLAVLHNPTTVAAMDWYMRQVGKFETAADLRERLAGFSASTLDVFIAQVNEVLTTAEADVAGPFKVPCMFGMSEFDPMLDFSITRDFVRSQFTDLTEEVWDWPYHAPPVPLTFEDYNRDYAALLDW